MQSRSLFPLYHWQASEPRNRPQTPFRTSLYEQKCGREYRRCYPIPFFDLYFSGRIATYLSMGPFLSFYMLYSVRFLHISPASLGVLIALGGVGSLAGASLAPRISKRSPLFTLFASGLLLSLFQFLIPLASLYPALSVVFLAVQQLAGDCIWTIYLVNETTLRQTVVPAKLLGRVNAAAQLASRGMLPVGALAAGFLGTSLGIAPSLWIGAAGIFLSTAWLIPLLAQL